MVASVWTAIALAGSQPGAASNPAPLVINLMPPPCPEGEDDIDAVVCAKRIPDYRIDPDILAGERSRHAPPISERGRKEAATAESCHNLPTKCQGSGVIPILPMAIKTIQAVTQAVKGEDWREPFQTGNDEYSAYRRAMALRRAREAEAPLPKADKGP